MRRRVGAVGAICLALGGAPAVAAPPTVVGTLIDDTVQLDHVMTLTGTCAAGNVLAVFAESGKSAVAQDSQSGTWVDSTSVNQGGSGFYRHSYRTLAADMVGGVDTITLHQFQASITRAVAVCFDGGTVEQSGTVDTPTANNTVQSITTGTITTVPQYVVAAVGVWHANINVTDVSAPPWTQLALVGTAGVQGALLVSYKYVTAAGGTETFTTNSTVSAWGAGYVAVPETGGGGGGPVVAPQSTLLTLGVGG